MKKANDTFDTFKMLNARKREQVQGKLFEFKLGRKK